MSFEVAARTLTGGFGPLVSVHLVGESRWRRLRVSPDDAPKELVMALEEALCSPEVDGFERLA